MNVLSPIHLRPATDADAPQVIALLQSEKLEAAFDPREFVVAVEDGRVVATARMKPLDGRAHEIASVAVAPHLRRSGLGARIVAAALARATGTVYALALAPGFFEKQGFQRLPEVPLALAEKAAGTCASTGFVPMSWSASPEAARDEVRRRYAEVATLRERAPEGECCEASAGGCCADVRSPYTEEELAALPEGAYLALGTGNPAREAELRPGEVVLDLGSGAGVDVLLAARAVGPGGRAIGVDFTREMVARARRNAETAGAANAEFHEAPIERVPLPDASVDVVISNCVVNLSTDKDATLREAHRVLRPGGRLVVSDTLRLAPGAPDARPSCDCTTGAMGAGEWKRRLAAAGFVGIDVRLERSHECCGNAEVGAAIIRARKA